MVLVYRPYLASNASKDVSLMAWIAQASGLVNVTPWGTKHNTMYYYSITVAKNQIGIAWLAVVVILVLL